MNYTWGEIQINALQKMFLNNEAIATTDLATLKLDRKYALYFNMMPQAATEGLLRLMTRGTPVIKTYTLTNTMDDLMYAYKSGDTVIVNDTDYVITGEKAKAYYFEVNNNAEITIEDDIDGTWTNLETIDHVADYAGSYTVYKGLIANANDRNIRIVFKSEDYLYSVRNIALYNVKWRTEDEVYNNTPKQKYALRTMIPDLFQVVSIEHQNLYGEKGTFDTGFSVEGNDTLVVDSKLKGNFIITYKAYPAKITAATGDTTRLPLPAEMISLLPLYIASECYKDDDASLATVYRNQFETELMNLDAVEEPLEFANNANWL